MAAYPSSSDVAAGQPTAYQHFNNLRADALRLGQSSLDAVSLGELLARHAYNLTCQYLAVNRLRIPASLTTPALVVVDGYILKATSHVDLAAGAVPSGVAATWYIFAVRTAGSTTFTLDVNTSAVESSGRRNIGSFYWNGSNLVPGSITLNLPGSMGAVLTNTPQVCDGRLTLLSGSPAPNTDQTGSVLYFTPFHGNRLALYAPSLGWTLYTFSEISISLTGWTTAQPYDIFIYDSTGTLTLENVAWASATTRGTAVVAQDGVLCKAGDLTHRYLGTVRMSSTGTCADTAAQRLVWNNTHRLRRRLYKSDLTDNWSSTTVGWAQWNTSSANQVEVVSGSSEGMIALTFNASLKASARGGCVGIGLDGTSASVADSSTFSYATVESSIQCALTQNTGLGYHVYTMLQGCIGASPSIMFYGDNGTTNGSILSAMHGWIEA